MEIRMRPDMAKVIVERPRISGHWCHEAKGRKARLREAIESDEGTPIHEGMKRPYQGHKCLNEHLGPLRRYLDKQVGRPWDKVFSEICRHINRSNPVQDHVRDHVEEYVVRNVVEIDGELCSGGGTRWGSRYGTPLQEMRRRHLWYVCPRTGLLRRVPPRQKPTPDERPKPPAYVRVSERLQCRFLDGRWELITLVPLPEVSLHECEGTDVVLDRPVGHMTPELARATYGAAVYAAARRPLGKRELKNYPIPIDWIDHAKSGTGA
jgi:hypothetical protein